jgi:hypothetical protein
MIDRMRAAFFRTVLVGIALMAVASIPGCNNKNADSSAPIDSGAVGAERTRALPCDATHREHCVGAGQPVKPPPVPPSHPSSPKTHK